MVELYLRLRYSSILCSCKKRKRNAITHAVALFSQSEVACIRNRNTLVVDYSCVLARGLTKTPTIDSMKPSNEQSLVDPLINNHSKSWFSPWWFFGSAKVQDGVDEEQQEIRKKQSHHEETNHDDGTMKESAIHKYGVPTSNDLIGMEFEDEETARWMDTSGSTSGCTLMDGHGNEEDDTLTTNVALMHIHGSQKTGKLSVTAQL